MKEIDIRQRNRPVAGHNQTRRIAPSRHQGRRSKMHSKPIKLIPFSKDHFKLLQDEITNSKFLMQWAGPKYIYPLTWEQMKNQIEERDEYGYKNFLFSAEHRDTCEIIGHVQISIIEGKGKIANIGSVLVFSKFRKNSFCKEMIKQIMEFGFNGKEMIELRLSVFDFNLTAIHCYQQNGFKKYNFIENAREVENEKRNSIQMKITKEEYKSFLKIRDKSRDH